MGVAPNRIDLLTSVTGVEFNDAWDARETAHYGDQIVHLISKAHLIQNKRAAGRPQDLVDVAALEKE